MSKIFDVAERAGVSISTVSNVLNKTKYVSPELVARVEQAVEELSYEVNPIARSMKKKKTGIIGVITEDMCGVFYPYTLYIYDTRIDALNQYSLTGGKAFNLQAHGDNLYVGHTDLFSFSSSSIEVIDLGDMKVKTTFSHPSTILQIEVGDDANGSIYIMDYDSISVYRMNDDGEYNLHNRMELCPNTDQYVGGFFLRQAYTI